MRGAGVSPASDVHLFNPSVPCKQVRYSLINSILGYDLPNSTVVSYLFYLLHHFLELFFLPFKTQKTTL